MSRPDGEVVAPLPGAVHDNGRLDAYRRRCDAAAWRRFDYGDRGTWPDSGAKVLVSVQGHMLVADFDREAEVWISGDVRYGITRRGDVCWRSLPAGPVLP